MAKASVIITTYNRPDALKCVLEALLKQTENDFEIIIGDDGSTEETQQLAAEYCQNHANITHVSQPDKGYRRSAILNKSAAKSNSDYLIFMDGDCIPKPDFVANHLSLRGVSRFVSGHRVMLNDDQTNSVLRHSPLNLTPKQKYKMANIPKGYFRRIKLSQWQNVKGCNLAVWKSDYLSVNGYDESFTGWGYEDSDFIIRLGKIGVRRTSGKHAVTVLHLNHPDLPRDNADKNFKKFEKRMTDNIILAPKGVNQYIKRPTISVALITHNEAARIKDCLDKLSWADEIIIVDDGSTDDTVLIAEKYTKKVYRRTFDGFGAQKNFALSKCKSDWILALDADEIISDDLERDILTAIQKAPDFAYAIRRTPYLRNQRIYFGDWGKDSVLRLFPRGKAKYSNKLVHEALETDLKQVTLEHPMKHYTINHVSEMDQKAIKYARLAAQGDLEKNKKVSIISPYSHAIWRFLRGYILKLGFLDGVNGYWIAHYCAKGTYLRYKNLLGLRKLS